MSVSTANPQTIPPGGDSRAIIVVPPDRRLEAAAALLPTGPRDLGAAERFCAYASENRISLDWMWARLDRKGRIESSVLIVPSAGRTAMLFHSPPAGQRSIASIGALIDHGCRSISEFGVVLLQVLIERGSHLDRSALRAGGFHELADLSYLDRPVPKRECDDLRVDWPDDCALQPFKQEQRELWQATLEATYVDTLDCPGLLGLRDTSDILDGHLGTGLFEPALWQFLFVEGKPAGMIMLNPSSNRTSIELVYLGLAPQARGRGLGSKLLRHGLGLLIGRRESNVSLAVDEGNGPALQLYATHGFRRMLRRIAMIRSIKPTAS